MASQRTRETLWIHKGDTEPAFCEEGKGMTQVIMTLEADLKDIQSSLEGPAAPLLRKTVALKLSH